MAALFEVPHQTEHGDTVSSDNPKLDAYKQAAWLVRSGRRYEIMSHLGGMITVRGPGVASITFAPNK